METKVVDAADLCLVLHRLDETLSVQLNNHTTEYLSDEPLKLLALRQLLSYHIYH
jgi:hypothetical protein